MISPGLLPTLQLHGTIHSLHANHPAFSLFPPRYHVSKALGNPRQVIYYWATPVHGPFLHYSETVSLSIPSRPQTFNPLTPASSVPEIIGVDHYAQLSDTLESAFSSLLYNSSFLFVLSYLPRTAMWKGQCNLVPAPGAELTEHGLLQVLTVAVGMGLVCFIMYMFLCSSFRECSPC